MKSLVSGWFWEVIFIAVQKFYHHIIQCNKNEINCVLNRCVKECEVSTAVMVSNECVYGLVIQVPKGL